MDIVHPKLGRPRFFSLNTLATFMNKKDLYELNKELEDSREVCGVYCPIVRVPVFCLITKRGAYTMAQDIFSKFYQQYIKRYPLETVKGFRRPIGTWSSGEYGVGMYTEGTNEMPTPFILEDYAYANTIIDAIEAAGYISGIEKYKI